MEDKKDWLGIACLWILLLQKMTDFKWLYHIIWPLLLFWAYYTVKLLQAELKTEKFTKRSMQIYMEEQKMGYLLAFVLHNLYRSLFCR